LFRYANSSQQGVVPCKWAEQAPRRNPKLPILFTSGFSENASNAEAHVAGSHYLQAVQPDFTGHYDPGNSGCGLSPVLRIYLRNRLEAAAFFD
jgi:hypothetical protein